MAPGTLKIGFSSKFAARISVEHQKWMDLKPFRTLLRTTGAAFTALTASGCVVRPSKNLPFARALGYGNLESDPRGLLDLPPGFQYRVLSSLGDVMSDGL